MSEKVCTKCGQVQPLSEFYPDKKNADGHSCHCRECNKAGCRERYQANKTKYNAQAEAWAKEHAGERKAYLAAYHAANRERLNQRSREYYLANKARMNAQTAIYAEANSERIAAYQVQYQADNREHINARARERDKARDAYVRGKHSAGYRERYRGMRKAILDALGGRCYCCGLDDYRFLTIDHVQNDGKQDRKPNGKQRNSYMVLRSILEIGCPRDRYQAACYNCNCARQLSPDKICPHQKG